MRRRFLQLSLLAALALAGCASKEAFRATDITGSAVGGAFLLTDHNGQPRKLADFHGKAVVIFFGYTHCPDVCPTTLGELSTVMKQLGAQASDVQVLFVTADPKRDTPQVLKDYAPAFYPSFIGLTGSGAAYQAFVRDYKLFSENRPLGNDGGYTVDHTASSYVLDREGRVRLLVPAGFGVENWVHDLKLVLAE